MNTQSPPTAMERARQLQHMVAVYGLAALAFAPRAKVEATVKGWSAHGAFDRDDPRSEGLLADAVGFAADLALFSPSASGATAVDRLLRQLRAKPHEEAAVAALRQVRFRLLRLRAEDPLGGLCCDDLATGEAVRLLGDTPPMAPGLTLAARLCPVPDTDAYVTFSAVTLLDDAALAVAMGFVRPGGKGLSSAYRCVEAIYRHVLRHGRSPVAGPAFSGFSDTPDFPYTAQSSDLDALAFAWAEAAPSPESLDAARAGANMGSVVEAISTAAFARQCRRDALADAYAQLATVQMETLQRRAVSGFSGRASLDTVAAEIDRLVAKDELPSVVRDLFDTLRRRVTVAPAGRRADADLDRLIQRIQALRAKTVDQGCTEQEALSAAEKVAELLDRHGLSLSELDVRRQSCAGVGIETSRRRTAPVDDCIPTVAAFFDCHAWIEKTADGLLRYIFFGLPADVEAAHYVYDLIDATFATETERFKAGAFYAELPTAERRGGTNSFQIGLSHGIVAKLHALRAERAAAMVGSTGRDLVPIKASVIDEELARLGLRLRTQARRTRTVVRDAYDAGHNAGSQFEIRHGVTDGGGKGRA